MATRTTRAVHVGLGVFSVALGTAPLIAPGAVARAAGLSARPRVLTILRIVGVRELVVGTGLVVRRSPAWLWARVVQDAIDVPLTAVTALKKHGEDRARSARVVAFLLAVTVVDATAALHSTRASAGASRR